MASFKSSRSLSTSPDRDAICSDALCSTCNENVRAFCCGDPCKPDYVSREDVLERSAAGCRICQLVTDFWASSSYSQEHMDIRWNLRYPELGLRLCSGLWEEIIAADIEFSGDLPWRHESQPTSRLIGAIETPFGVQIRSERTAIGHSIKGNSGSPEVMEMLKSWDSFCRSNHSCSLGSDLRQLPTRVIDVGSPDDSCGPRLFIPKGKKGVYLTLSHCWGGHLTTKLLSSNICAYEKAIEERTLPATFRDAISVTRKLGFRYLWIDALCIIQDSNEDWEREVGKMASVYKNCRLMLSATDSTNGDGGLFRDRNDDVLFQLSEQLSRRCGFPNGAYAHRPRASLFKATWQAALSQRGWALQEAILAPVIIYFCDKQIFWECRRVQISENGILMTVEQARSVVPSRAIRLIPEPGVEPRSDEYSFWYDILEEFSRRKLTFSADVLPAVVGLAQESAATLHDVYVNGLWKKDLARGILWEARVHVRGVDERMAPARRTEQSAMRAPSWSWASVDGCVLWHRYDDTQYLFEILGLEPPVNVSTYIASRSALLIRGVVKKCLCLIGIGNHVSTVKVRDYKEPSTFDVKIYRDWVYTEVDLSEVSYCYLLQGAETPSIGLQCLILEPMYPERQVFRRIGVCWTTEAWAEDFFAGIESTEIRIC